MNDLELAAIVIALVGVVRSRRVPGSGAFEPALDGTAVPLVAAVAGGVVGLLYHPAPPWPAAAHGVAVGLVGVGAMTTLKYAGDKVGTAVGRAVSLARPKNGMAKAHGDEAEGVGSAPSP